MAFLLNVNATVLPAIPLPDLSVTFTVISFVPSKSTAFVSAGVNSTLSSFVKSSALITSIVPVPVTSGVSFNFAVTVTFPATASCGTVKVVVTTPAVTSVSLTVYSASPANATFVVPAFISHVITLSAAIFVIGADTVTVCSLVASNTIFPFVFDLGLYMFK